MNDQPRWRYNIRRWELAIRKCGCYCCGETIKKGERRGVVRRSSYYGGKAFICEECGEGKINWKQVIQR